MERFLKEHLFADIFERDVLTYDERELATVSILAAIGGVEPMARSHMGICLNLGITPAQLHQLLDIVSRNIGPGEADAVRKELNTLLQAKGLPVVRRTGQDAGKPLVVYFSATGNTKAVAELMAKLYAASEEPLPSALLPIRDRFAALFQRARDDQNAGCQTDYVHAAIIADQMMSNASELRGLHGDLHHENIMFSSRGCPHPLNFGIDSRSLFFELGQPIRRLVAPLNHLDTPLLMCCLVGYHGGTAAAIPTLLCRGGRTYRYLFEKLA